MKKVTVSLDEKLIQRSRDYARQKGTTLNQLIRDLLAQTVDQDRKQRVTSFLDWYDQSQITPKDGSWLSREEAHER